MSRNFMSHQSSRRAAERKLARTPAKGNLDMRELTVVRGSDRATARTRNIACAVCERPIVHTSGRRPQVCSTRCRNRKNNPRRVRKAFLIGDSGGEAKCTKISNENNALQRAKQQSSIPILGPAAVLACELFDRKWQPTVSSGGIAVEIGRIRPRALVGAS